MYPRPVSHVLFLTPTCPPATSAGRLDGANPPPSEPRRLSAQMALTCPSASREDVADASARGDMPWPSASGALADRLQEWVREPGAEGEDRAAAAILIEHAWRTRAECLPLSTLELSSLPDLPGWNDLKILALNGHAMAHFPRIEAPQLELLYVRGFANSPMKRCESFAPWEARIQAGKLALSTDSNVAIRFSRAPNSANLSEWASRVRRQADVQGAPLNLSFEKCIPSLPSSALLEWLYASAPGSPLTRDRRIDVRPASNVPQCSSAAGSLRPAVDCEPPAKRPRS